MIPGIDSRAESFPVAHFEADADGRLTGANEIYRSLVAGGTVALGSAPWSVAPPSDRAAAEAAWQASASSGDHVSIEFRVISVDGAERWIRADFRRRGDGFDGLATDVTSEVRDRDTARRLEALFDAVDEVVVVLDRTGRPVLANGAARRLVGASATAPLADDPGARTLVDAVRDQIPRDVVSPGASGSHWNGEIAFRAPDGRHLTLAVHVVVERAADGSVESYAAIARDITAQRELQSELAHRATHDALTGLPNRTLFVTALTEAIERARSTRSVLAVLFVDLDNLKEVNDSIGHEYGDSLLSTVAHRLTSATRPSDVVARIGGDEFVILCDGVGDARTAQSVAERIRQSVTGQIVVQGVEITTGASIGVAVADGSALDESAGDELAVSLMRDADTAMYHAKMHGRSRVEMFTEQMRISAAERLQLAADLERAAARNELVNVYMPVASTHDGRIVAAEALVRWEHPVRGLLTPPAFLDIAEEKGLIVGIGEGVLRRACADLRRWIDTGRVEPGFTVHVNMTARELVDHTVVERVMTAIRSSGLSPSNLVLDVREDAVRTDDAVTMRTLHTLRRNGVRLALDDFGAGTASLTRLQALPVDVLKLDEKLVRRLGQPGGADDAVTRAIVQLAHSLGMSVVAEWVTSPEQMDRLRLLGCDAAQGHHIGTALPADAMVWRPGGRSGSTL